MAEISRKMVIEAERNQNHRIGKMVIKRTKKNKEKLTERDPKGGRHR